MEYGFNFCPAFWDFLDLKNKSKEVFTIQQVFDEVLQAGKKKIQIPVVCRAMNISCMDPYEMLQRLKPTFVLKGKA